ncbi:MAG: cyclase family protein [Dehalococcoidia bacterium]
MHWIDVTSPIRPGMHAYPGDPVVAMSLASSLADGDGYDVTALTLGTHTGTHVDAPSHFIAGAPAIEALDLDALIGPAYVADAVSASGHLDAAALALLGVPEHAERVLLKTANSRLWDAPAFARDYVALTEDGARWLVDRAVRLVGIDYLSIAPYADPAPAHVALLSAGVVIVEGLDLRAVAPGDYTLVCLPLLIPGADGAPARVLLGRDEGRIAAGG